jgi:predicted MFS family arabinose efflux permease
MMGVQVQNRSAWTIVIMLSLFQLIAQMDKLVFAFAAKPLMVEFGLTASDYGLIVASYGTLFAFSGIMVGLFVVPRVDAKWILVALAIVWCVAQLSAGIVSSIGFLVCSRVLLGAGEGPASSCALHMAFGWFPPERRSVPVGFVQGGNIAGAIVAGPLLSQIIASFGWRAAFVACGMIGSAWVVAWIILGREGPHAAIRSSTKEPSIARRSAIRFLRDRSVQGAFIVGFAAYWSIGTGTNFMPLFLQNGLGLSLKQTGFAQMLMGGASATIMVGSSFVSQAMISRGFSSTAALGRLTAAALMLACVMMVAGVLCGNAIPKIALLAIGGGLGTVPFVLLPVLLADFLPARDRGPVVVVIFSAITLATVIAPIVVGRLIDAAGPHAARDGYQSGFLIQAAVLGAASIAGYFLLHPDRSRRSFSEADAPLSEG